MAIINDISIDSNGNIRRTGDAHNQASPGYYTVLELHRFLQDLADNQSETGDDLISIIRANPSSRSTDNIIEILSPYNIDDDLSEYIYDGSIIQDNGNTIYDGIVNFGDATYIQIIQNGSVISNDFWNNNGGLNSNAAAGISHRFMVKVRNGGSDIDFRRLIGLSREYGFTYAEFSINGSTRGNNVLALSENIDLNNSTAVGIISGYSTITNISAGYNLIDLDNGNGLLPYYSLWNRDGHSINDFYEYAKYLTRRGSTKSLYGIDADIFRGITHEISISGGSGTFVEPEQISWFDGTAQLLAVDNTDASLASKIWVQLLTGMIATNSTQLSGANGSLSITNGIPISKTIPPVFIGQSTGTSLIGSFGLGIKATDLIESDSLIDLNDTKQIPPNIQTFTVSGLVSGEDTVLVTQNDGFDNIDYNQFAANGLQTMGSNTLVITTTIPTDTPSSGTIRAFNGTSYDRIVYNSYTNDTFTLAGTLANAISNGANVFVSYIDEVSSGSSSIYSAKYITDRSLVVNVRDGGVSPIKPFKTSATFGNGGGSVTAIRTTDE